MLESQIQKIIPKIIQGHDLSSTEMQQAVEAIMEGTASEIEIATLLTGLHFKGEHTDEIAGAAAALREKMTPIVTQHSTFIDTCGTGGDGSNTFNISTAAALVTAACGLPVAKHGNRAVTSRSGSADVLKTLGVNIEADLETTQHCLDELGICFCFAPLFHGSMKHAGSVRKRLGIPTVFNYIGPLANPASAPLQLIGVGKPHLREKLASALLKLDLSNRGNQKTLVVHGEIGLDEISCEGKTHVSIVKDGSIEEETWSPSDFGLAEASLDDLKVSSVEESAGVIQEILSGKNQSAARTIVLLNSAAALWLAEKAETLSEGATLAAAAIDSGKAADLLKKLGEVTNA